MTLLWYLARGSGTVAAILLVAVLGIGVARSERWTRPWMPRLMTVTLHRRLSWLLLAVLAVHLATVILDSFAPMHLVDLVVPFVSSYRTIWTGLGTVALLLLLVVVASSLVIRSIGFKGWRLLHWSSYPLAAVVLVHALGDGTDARQWWQLLILSGLLLGTLGATVWRLAGRSLESGSAGLWARTAAAVLAVLVGVAVIAVAVAGPLSPDWARRAGTPPDLLAGGSTGSAAPGAPLAPGLDDPLAGTVQETADGRVVTLADLRDPTLTLILTVQPGVPGQVTVEIDRSGVNLCLVQTGLADTLIPICPSGEVEITLRNGDSGLQGGLITPAQ